MHQNTVITGEQRYLKHGLDCRRWLRSFKILPRRLQAPLPALLICLIALVAHAQSAGQMSHSVAMSDSDAQRLFEKMKTLAGTWQGSLTTTPQVPGMGEKIAQIVLRMTSRGNALMHEITVSGMPDDPITMFYLDGDRLLLTHYCDAGNRPRMEGKISADGTTLEFDFIDLAGGNQKGHMHHAVITIIDANHHIEDWTFMLPGDKPIKARFDLMRLK